MNEAEQRGRYWDIVYKIEDFIQESGRGLEELLEEIKGDLEK